MSIALALGQVEEGMGRIDDAAQALSNPHGRQTVELILSDTAQALARARQLLLLGLKVIDAIDALPGPMQDKITYGEKYGPAMVITDQAEADRYFNECVEHTMRMKPTDRTDAERIERSNLGYWAGYYDNPTRERVERLFRCAHPVFGAIAGNGPPTPEQAFELGLARGSRRH